MTFFRMNQDNEVVLLAAKIDAPTEHGCAILTANGALLSAQSAREIAALLNDAADKATVFND